MFLAATCLVITREICTNSSSSLRSKDCMVEGCIQTRFLKKFLPFALAVTKPKALKPYWRICKASVRNCIQEVWQRHSLGPSPSRLADTNSACSLLFASSAADTIFHFAFTKDHNCASSTEAIV